MPMVVADPRRPNTPIVLANKAFLDLTGYSEEEVIGTNCRFLQGEDTAPEAIEAIRRGLAADDHYIEVEILNYRKDGSSFWNQLHISPVHDVDGKTIYYFASQKDVTARRRAQELEAVERLLLMEVDHRAMNALALVEGVLSLTQAQDRNAYSKAVRRRIGAIARVHRILARESWKGIRLDQLIKDEASDLNILTSGPPVDIPPTIAQPLAIVFHELISNAAHHGALLYGRGSVHVSWEARPNEVIVCWRETAQGRIIGADPAPGLGLELIRAVIERQLRGVADLEWRPEGMSARLIIPISGPAAYAN
jgi:PAS domain S-box-containing protein